MNTIRTDSVREMDHMALLPLLLGLRQRIRLVADAAASKRSFRALPVDDDVLLATLGLISLDRTVANWLQRSQVGRHADDQVPIADDLTEYGLLR